MKYKLNLRVFTLLQLELGKSMAVFQLFEKLRYSNEI